MGWTVLYIAFGVVALWLLGEVLLQYKARLRWRLLAFVGFLGVVAGVLTGSVPVIGIGAAAFAVGQTFVTLSFRRGFSTGWALGGGPGVSKRRKADPGRPAQEPTLEVSDLEYQSAPPAPPSAPPDDVPVYEPEPLDDTGSYGVYGQHPRTDGPPPAPSDDLGYGYQAAQGDTGYPPYAPSPAEGPWGTPPEGVPTPGHEPSGTPAYGYDGYDGTGAYGMYGGYPGPGPEEHAYGDQGYAGAYGDAAYGYGADQAYGTNQAYGVSEEQDPARQYVPYPGDPYVAGPPGPGLGVTGAGPYAGYGGQDDGHPPVDPYAGDPYGTPATPPGGVWMPQQRATEGGYGTDPQLGQPSLYPYQDPGSHDPAGTGYEYGPGEQQYRY